MTSTLKIYCDGACKGNPGIGGWGAFFIYKGYRKEIWGYEKHSTNQRMELLAAIRALQLLKESCVIQIYSDSQYLIKGMSEWLDGWKNKDWKTSTKANVANRELWEQLDELNQFHKIEWNKVKGHSDDVNNSKADELANRGIIEQVDFGTSDVICGT